MHSCANNNAGPPMAFDFDQSGQFLQLLGKNGSSRLRAFWPRHVPVPDGTPRAFKASYTEAPAVLPTWQERGLGVYVVIGNGGDIDDEITSCPALFIEWDDRPKSEQLTAWRAFNLPEPTFMVDTGGKSVHLYWVLNEPIPPDRFRDLIARLIKLTGADPTNRNPSRVMRLPGAWHFSWDPDARQIRPNGQATIVRCSGHRYDADLFDDLLPQIELDPPGLPLLQTSTELPPRPPEQLLDAMQKVPEFHHGEGRYDELLKLAKRLHVELGRDAAFHLLRAHSPHVKDMAAYFTKAPDRISPGSIWPFLRDQYGIDIRRHDLKAATAANSSPGPLQDAPPASGDGTPTAAVNGRGKRRTLAPDEVLQLLPERLGGTPRLNIRTNAFHAGGTIYTADDLARVYLHLSSETERWTKEATCDAAVELAKNRAFDPVEEELNQIARATQPLDDEHWQRLDHHLLGIDDPIAASFLPQFLIAAVARIYRPGCGVRRTPVLIGSQWRGKTRLGRILFGADHWIENISDLGKDDLLRLQAGWGVELSELNGITRRKDQEALKAFLTATDDVFRAPYGKGTARYQRRCVFWGTSNGPPLRDLSGSTRFVCIPLPDRMLPLEWAESNRRAIWSRAIAEFRQIPPGEEPWDHASEDERNAIQSRNSNHQEIDPWSDAIATILRHSIERPVTIPYVLDQLEIPMGHRNNAMASRIRQLAEAAGWGWDRRRLGGGDKLQGLWPAETQQADSGHPGHPVGTPRGARPPASDAKATGHPGHPGHPISIKLSGEGNREGVEAQGERGEGVSTFGVPGVPTSPAAPSQLPSQPIAGVPAGVPTGCPVPPPTSQRETATRRDASGSGDGSPPPLPLFSTGQRVVVFSGDQDLPGVILSAPSGTGTYRVQLDDGPIVEKAEGWLTLEAPG
jgi:hypothetical protein